MAHLRDIVFDSARPAATARFWAAALDGHAVAPYDEAELARLRALGVNGPEDDPTVLVEPAGPGPRLWFQLVPEHKSVKNRTHLDLRTDDVEAEVVRLAGLGAEVLVRHDDHVVLADPEGNEFCLFPNGAQQGA
ncbi:VOC family protein [Streptomyces sp. NPDC047315]|uniref:VOC family protein n=1 Tax=Streptomyces sp. NPDC047315 TaxID=3155142 RepID=UPI0033FFFD3F